MHTHPYCTKQLNTRIIHHHTNFFNNRPIHISKHFNLPDHSITNLRVQPIDCATNPYNAVEELHRLERFWVKTLQTLTPHVTDLISDQAPLIHNPCQIATQHQNTHTHTRRRVCVCACVCVRVCVCVCVCACVCACICMYVGAGVLACVFSSMIVCMCVCLLERVCSCVNVHVCVYTYV